MGIRERRRELERACARFDAERVTWRAETGRLRALAVHNRELITVGGGFLGGVLAGQIRWRVISRIGGLAGAIASLALRSPLATMLLDGMTTAKTANQQSGDTSSE